MTAFQNVGHGTLAGRSRSTRSSASAERSILDTRSVFHRVLPDVVAATALPAKGVELWRTSQSVEISKCGSQVRWRTHDLRSTSSLPVEFLRGMPPIVESEGVMRPIERSERLDQPAAECARSAESHRYAEMLRLKIVGVLKDGGRARSSSLLTWLEHCPSL